MKLELDGATVYLGRLRKDGTRNIERVRFHNLRILLPALRRAKVGGKMKGKRLYVALPSDTQLMLFG